MPEVSVSVYAPLDLQLHFSKGIHFLEGKYTCNDLLQSLRCLA
jgi:hypothetical protein